MLGVECASDATPERQYPCDDQRFLYFCVMRTQLKSKHNLIKCVNVLVSSRRKKNAFFLKRRRIKNCVVNEPVARADLSRYELRKESQRSKRERSCCRFCGKKKVWSSLIFCWEKDVFLHWMLHPQLSGPLDGSFKQRCYSSAIASQLN